MGLRVGGFGVLPQTVIDALTPREADLDLILKLPREPLAIPSKKSAQQKLAAELDRQLEVLSRLIQSASPELKPELQQLHALAREVRLDLEGRLLSWVVTATDRRAPEAPPLESPEAAAVFALFGNTFSDGEMAHAVTVLDAHLSPADRKQHVGALADATVELADQVGRRTSKKSRSVFMARTGPLLGGLVAARAITTLAQLEPSVGLAVNAVALQLGFQLSRRTGQQAAANLGYQFGVNRFEGEADHDLALLYDRATKLHQKLWSKTDAEGQSIVDTEVALLRYLTEQRRSTWPGRSVSDLEKRAVAKFEQLAKALEEVGVEGARGPIEGLGLKRADLAALPSLPDLDRAAHPRDFDRTTQAIQGAIVEAAKGCLVVSNLGLRRLLDSLESKEPKSQALTGPEQDALRRLLGPTPNVAEVLALGRLVRDRGLKLEALWPDAELRAYDGRLLSPEDARLLFDTLGDRDRGSRIESIGRVVALLSPFLGSAAAYASALSIGNPGLDTIQGWGTLLGTVAVALAASVSGNLLGQHIEKQGRSIKIATGLDTGLALGREYTLALPRLLDAGTLLAGDRENIAARLIQEAGVLDVLVGSVSHARQELAGALASLKAQDQHDPQVAEGVTRLTAALTQLDGAQGVHYGVLTEVAKNLREIAALPTVQDMRNGYAGLRLELGGLMAVTWNDVVSSQTQHELSAPVEVYFRIKHGLRAALAEWQPGQAIPQAALVDADRIANGYKELPKGKRPEKDALDKLCVQLLKAGAPGADPRRIVDRSLLAEVQAPAFAAHLHRARAEISPISRERAGEVAQEVINALWSQLLPTYGLVPDGLAAHPPQLQNIEVARVQGLDAQSLPSFKVQARIVGGGKVEIPVNAAGVVDPDWANLRVDLGARLITQLAAEAMKTHLAVLDGAAPASVPLQLKARTETGAYTFEAKLGPRVYELTMGPKGELDAGSIRARE